MIHEELYVTINDSRRRVDLRTPSGIVLRYNSNLFNDLSKIDKSYSYSFELPMSENNRHIFDLVEDIRHASIAYGKKIPCEYYRDGVQMMRGAYLYITETSDTYKCNLIWDFAQALLYMADHDVSLRELDDYATIQDYENKIKTTTAQKEITYYGATPHSDTSTPFTTHDGSRIDFMPYEIDNRKVSNFYYDAGVPYFARLGGGLSKPYVDRKPYRTGEDSDKLPIFATPPPVVPVYVILRKIAAFYGLDLSALEKPYLYSENTWQDAKNDILKVGCVPLVKTEINRDLQKRMALQIKAMRYLGDATVHYKNGDNKYDRDLSRVLIYTDAVVPADNIAEYIHKGVVTDEFQSVYMTTILENVTVDMMRYGVPGILYSQDPRIGVKASGQFIIRFRPDKINPETDKVSVSLKLLDMYDPENDDTVLTFDAYYDGEASDHSRNGYYTFISRFLDEEGNSVTGTLSDAGMWRPMVFALDENLEEPMSVEGSVELCTYFDEGIDGHYTNVWQNLPDISCLEFLKSLFYQMGAFPSIELSGALNFNLFSDIGDNQKNDLCLSWDNKLLSQGVQRFLGETKYSHGDFARSNYYLMKNEDLDKRGRTEDEEDKYAEDFFSISCYNDALKKESTVIQLPYNNAYIENGKNKAVATGNTIKYWDLQDWRTIKAAEAKPMMGMFYLDTRTQWYPNIVNNADEVHASVKAWSFADIVNSGVEKSYRYLQKIMQQPYVVTERLLLSAIDLAEIDYSKPIYLSKYNRYFAIISIEADQNGISKVELIRLPDRVDTTPEEDINIDRSILNVQSQIIDASGSYEFDTHTEYSCGYRDLTVLVNASLDGINSSDNTEYTFYVYRGGRTAATYVNSAGIIDHNFTGLYNEERIEVTVEARNGAILKQRLISIDYHYTGSSSEPNLPESSGIHLTAEVTTVYGTNPHSFSSGVIGNVFKGSFGALTTVVTVQEFVDVTTHFVLCYEWFINGVLVYTIYSDQAQVDYTETLRDGDYLEVKVYTVSLPVNGVAYLRYRYQMEE